MPCAVPGATMGWLPKISMGLMLDALARRLRCAECGGALLSIKPWRQTDASGSAWRRGSWHLDSSLSVHPVIAAAPV